MDSKSSKPSPRRRAILQGSLAAPVVLTVSSPAAAQMTTLGRCLANLANGEQPRYLIDTQNADTWMRIRVPVVTLSTPNGDIISEFAFFDQEANAYRQVDATGHPLIKLATNEQQTLRVTANGERWGLMWVNEVSKAESNRIQIEAPSGFRPVTGTCWTSFRSGSAA